MAGIVAGPRPKLEALGQALSGPLSDLTGRPIYPIVARHARRKVNPPNDTWVAWSANKRGYKMLPHFQVGLWQDHAFVQAGVIYEAQGRAEFADALEANWEVLVGELPGEYRWLEDYSRPAGILHKDMRAEDVARIAGRLRSRREADAMVGLAVGRDEVVRLGPGFADLALQVMRTVLPVWRLAALVRA